MGDEFLKQMRVLYLHWLDGVPEKQRTATGYDMAFLKSLSQTNDIKRINGLMEIRTKHLFYGEKIGWSLAKEVLENQDVNLFKPTEVMDYAASFKTVTAKTKGKKKRSGPNNNKSNFQQPNPQKAPGGKGPK
jgi:hypothetical protein